MISEQEEGPRERAGRRVVSLEHGDSLGAAWLCVASRACADQLPVDRNCLQAEVVKALLNQTLSCEGGSVHEAVVRDPCLVPSALVYGYIICLVYVPGCRGALASSNLQELPRG